MGIRREPTYLSTGTWRALLIIARSREQTPDEVADTLLDETIKQRYPSVIDYLNQVNKLEREIIKVLGGGNNDSHSEL